MFLTLIKVYYDSIMMIYDIIYRHLEVLVFPYHISIPILSELTKTKPERLRAMYSQILVISITSMYIDGGFKW